MRDDVADDYIDADKMLDLWYGSKRRGNMAFKSKNAPKEEENRVALPSPATHIMVKVGLPRFSDPLFGGKKGDFVKVRPAGNDDTKTYLGIYLGDLQIGVTAGLRKDGTLVIESGASNPAIYI